ncbi:MAG: hypothetical protein Q4G58_10550 [bacterium]|nr:hypothetical protein [bacterium]
MKKKILLFCMLVLMLFCLSGCSKASVTSELKFNTDGSGSRSVYATIDAEDASKIEGGVPELDRLLQEAAPEGVTIRRSDADNGDAIYQFTFFFDNINQYNQKIKEITGKDHNATWYTSNSVFLSNIEFTEDDCTTDLITWAIDAIKNKIGGWAAKNLSYEVKKNEVYYDNALQYSGTDHPKFVLNVTPKVKKVNVYTTYSFQGDKHKKLEVLFEEGGLNRVNLTDAKDVLSKYSSHYTFDRANNIITYDLKNEEIEEFLMAVDPTIVANDNKFTIIKNPFQQKYEIYECYKPGNFFSLFDMSNSPYIYDYVKLPAVMSDGQLTHTDSLGNVTVPEGYDVAGAFRFDETYTASFSGDRKIDLKDIEVNYDIGNTMSVKREVEVTYIKNGCEIDKEELSKYYQGYDDTISVSDTEDTIKVTFIKNLKLGKNAKDQIDKLSSYKVKSGIKFRTYEVSDELDVTRYLPNVEGYEWNKETITYQYAISVEPDTGITEMDVQNLTLSGEQELSTAIKDEQYVISGSDNASKLFTFKIESKKIYDFFYLYIILFIFVLVVAGLVAVWMFLKKKKIIERQDYDDLDNL